MDAAIGPERFSAECKHRALGSIPRERCSRNSAGVRDGPALPAPETAEVLTLREVFGEAIESEGMDRELSWAERLRIRFHAMMCKGCTNFEKQMGTLRAASRAFADHFSPGDKH